MKHITTIGIDIGDKRSQICVLDNKSGEVLFNFSLRTDPAGFKGGLGHLEPATAVLEVSGQAGWISRLLGELGHSVVVADPRKARRLMGKEDKSDRADAEFLARIGRLDPTLLSPVTLRSEQTQCDLATIRSRNALVKTRTLLINHVRGVVKSVGRRLPSCSADKFDQYRGALPEVLEPALTPLMQAISELNAQIRAMDKMIERLGKEDYPTTQILQQITGVGPITALAFVLIIERAERFRNSRQVGAYLGLCRRRYQSGDSDPEMRISRAGDALLRRLLVNCAHHILGRYGAESDLRTWGLAYAERGGRSAKKRAVVGVARRLAVLMHRLWKTGASYQPHYDTDRKQAA